MNTISRDTITHYMMCGDDNNTGVKLTRWKRHQHQVCEERYTGKPGLQCRTLTNLLRMGPAIKLYITERFSFSLGYILSTIHRRFWKFRPILKWFENQRVNFRWCRVLRAYYNSNDENKVSLVVPNVVKWRKEWSVMWHIFILYTRCIITSY